MIDKSRLIHEKYHQKTKSQYKVIGEKNFTYRLIINLLSEYLQPKMNILDIGCGAGTLDFFLGDKGYKVTGVDISKKAIDSCNKTLKNLKLKKIKFIHAKFPEDTIKGKYDFVIFTEVIEHLNDDVVALKSIYKLLKPSGILFLTTPSSNAPLYKLGLTKQFDKQVGHLRRYSPQGITNIIETEGFKINKTIKSEGIIRNFLFVNKIAGKFVRFIKLFVSDFVTFIDETTVPLFGESNIIVIAQKNSKTIHRFKK